MARIVDNNTLSSDDGGEIKMTTTQHKDDYMITVPEGAEAYDLLEVMTSSGLRFAEVPGGVKAGDTFVSSVAGMWHTQVYSQSPCARNLGSEPSLEFLNRVEPAHQPE